MDEQNNSIINRVAQSNLLVFNPEELYDKHPRVVLDIKGQLVQGLILREKEFREFVKTHDWEQYRGKNVAVTCSADAIIPTWAYMLIAAKLEGISNFFVFGGPAELEQSLYQTAMDKFNWLQFENQNVVVKGCGDNPVPAFAYVEAVRRLRPLAKKIFYGEPCSTVPVYKRE